MNAKGVATTNVLEDNKEFVAYLHAHSRERNVPVTCDKSSLSDYWQGNRRFFMETFTSCTGKAVNIKNIREFFQQAAESYKG